MNRLVIQGVFISFILMFCISCISFNWFKIVHIADDYVVTWGDYYDAGDIGYTLSCDLCYEDRIQDIKNITWSTQIIIVEKNNKNKNRWHVFLAQGDSLQCCRDVIIDSITKLQVDSILKEKKITHLQEKIFIK